MGECIFSVCIPSWNNLDYLKLCVESLRKNSILPHQLIVHVNGGADGTLDWVRAQGIDHTETRENVGVCASLNMMRSLVQTDLLVFLNDDMYVCPGWDEVIYRHIKKLGSRSFFLGSTCIQKEPHAFSPTIYGDFGDSPSTFREGDLLRDFMKFQAKDTRYVCAPLNIVPLEIWDGVGGYSEEFSPGWGSDPDFTAKVWEAGVRHLLQLGDSRVYHFGHVTTSKHPNMNPDWGLGTFQEKWGCSPSEFRDKIMETSQTTQDSQP